MNFVNLETKNTYKHTGIARSNMECSSRARQPNEVVEDGEMAEIFLDFSVRPIGRIQLNHCDCLALPLSEMQPADRPRQLSAREDDIPCFRGGPATQT